MTIPTPTPEAIEALALELEASGNFDRFTTFIADARWILSRFVRREEHCKDCCCARSWAALGEVSGADSIAGHIENMRAELDRLRAELRGQRCDGSGVLRTRYPRSDSSAGNNGTACPSCPACKPTDATPKGDGGRTPESVSTAKTNESLDSYSRGFADGRDAAAAANVQSVEHVVKLHPETLRALVAAILVGQEWINILGAPSHVDELLAKLEETKPCL